MDFAKQEAIAACGCGWSERAHQIPRGDPELLDVRPADGAAAPEPCGHFHISAAALTYARHLSIAASAPGGGQGPVCGRCGNRGHGREVCPL